MAIRLTRRQKAILQLITASRARLVRGKNFHAGKQGDSLVRVICPSRPLDCMIRDGMIWPADHGAGQYAITAEGREIAHRFERDWTVTKDGEPIEGIIDSVRLDYHG